MVDTSLLCGFPKELHLSLYKPGPEQGRFLLAVEAGIKVRDLYGALAFDDVDRGYRGPRRDIPGASERRGVWTLPVLGVVPVDSRSAG